MSVDNKSLIVLFDDTCNLCNSSIRFILKNDKEKKFRFSGLNSAFSKKILENTGIQNSDTIILMEDEKLFFKSTAILRIIRHFHNFWSFFYFLVIIPEPLRDFCYELVSKNRKKWFGNANECELYTTTEIERFI